MIKIKPNHFISMMETSVVKRSDGTDYTIRGHLMRYFFPDEWKAFYDALKKRQKITFKFLINLGARINEVRHIRVQDIDFERKSVVLRWTKARNPDGTRKVRIIPVSSEFIRWISHIVKELKLKPTDTFPILSTPAANLAMKKALQKVGIKDWKMFSVHNVRKTLETWLIALDVDSLKIAKHFGHNIAIASKHYVSPDTFSYEDKKMMREIIGDLYSQGRF